MLYLFGPKETDFINGDSDLIHHTYDEVVDRSKGFYLKFKVALDKNKRYKTIKKEMIINAYTPDGWNQFRVFDIYNHSNYVEVVATQLHYDLNYKKVFPFIVNKATAQIALNVFVENFKSDLPNFQFTSNINDLHDFSTDADLERLDDGHNALEILNRIASRWGGELKVDGYKVHLVHKLGTFTNALLYEHKNISEFVDETSMSEIVTRIHAVSRFRLEREEGSAKEPEEVTIQVVVDSPLIDEYAQVYEEDYTNNDARTRDQLISWANLKYSTNNVDKPARSITVETNIIDGQEINYGDDLVLKYTKHDVDEIIRCVGYQYNPNSRQYISVTLGSNTGSLTSTITGAVHDSTKNQLSNIEKQVQIIKYAANNVNRVTTGPLPIPDPIEGDMWYYHPEGRPNEIELRIFQNNGWVTLISDMTGENVRRAIEDLELEAEGLAEEIEASELRAAEKADKALQDAKDWAENLEDGLKIHASQITAGEIETARLKVTQIVNQGLSGNEETITQLLIGDDVFNSSVTNLAQQKVADELTQETEYIEGDIPFYEYTPTTTRALLEGERSMAIYLPLNADTIMDGKRVVVDLQYKPREGSKGNHASYIQYGDIKSSELILYSSLNSARYHIFIPPGTRNGNIMDLHTNIVNPGNYTWADIISITVSTVEYIEVPIDGPETGAISSQITQLYNMINLSILGKDGAMTRIAMGEEGIQIDGKLLHITAKTFIDEAVIKSAMIDTIDAGKITTGELNARDIRVINLDANSISGNEASFIKAMFTNRNSALQITGSGITVSRSNGTRSFEVDSSGAHFYSDTGPGAYITTHNIVTWNGSSWEDTGANSVLFASELSHSIGIGYKILTNGKYMTRDAIRLDRSGTGVPELQVNLPIQNLIFSRGTVSGQNGSYLQNSQKTGGIWVGDNGKLILKEYGELYNNTYWKNK